MVTFIGTYTGRLDDRGRLVFPAGFKAMLPPGADQRFVIKKDLFQPCLQMFTMEEWENRSREVKSKLNFFNKDHANFWREFMRNRAFVEPDPKVGRILIPKDLLDSIGAVKEVVFSGNDFMIEIWAAERFSDTALSDEEYIAIAEGLPDTNR